MQRRMHVLLMPHQGQHSINRMLLVSQPSSMDPLQLQLRLFPILSLPAKQHFFLLCPLWVACMCRHAGSACEQLLQAMQNALQ